MTLGKFLWGLKLRFDVKRMDVLHKDLLKAILQVNADRTGVIFPSKLEGDELVQTMVISQIEKLGPYMARDPLKMQAKLGWTVQVDHSWIRGAGLGMWLRGTAPPGTIIAFYPGTIYDAAKCTIADRMYTVSLPGGVLDGNPRDPFVRELFDTNNLAIANYMNHPPKGKYPNVIDLKMLGLDTHFSNRLCPTRVIEGCEEDVEHYIPCVITTRYVSNEEIFWNYGYEQYEGMPGAQLPKWFHSIDYRKYYKDSLTNAKMLLVDDMGVPIDEENDEDPVVFTQTKKY